MAHQWLKAACLCAALALMATGTVASANDAPKSANKWRVELDGKAESDGTIVLRVTPNEGTATDVSVAVTKGTTENSIAQSTRDALQAQLPVDRYHIEVDDGEDVLIKKKSGQPDFRVELASSGVAGVEVELERE